MMCPSSFQLQTSALSVWAVLGMSGLDFAAQAGNVKLFRLFWVFIFYFLRVTLAMFPKVSVVQKQIPCTKSGGNVI